LAEETYWGRPFFLRLLALLLVAALGAALGAGPSGWDPRRLRETLASLDPATRVVSVLLVVPLVATSPADAPGTLIFFAALALLLSWASGLPLARLARAVIFLSPLWLLLGAELFYPRGGTPGPWWESVRFHRERLPEVAAVALRSLAALLCTLSLLRGISLEELLLVLPRGPLSVALAVMGNFLLSFRREMERAEMARRARIPQTSWPRRMRLAASSLGMLYLRARRKSEALSLALESRGWSGSGPVASRPALRKGFLAGLALAVLLGSLLAVVGT